MTIPDDATVARAAAAHPLIRLVVLFGSAATGRMRRESDIDIGVLLDGADRLSPYEQLELVIRGLCPPFPSHLTDFVILNAAGPTLSHRVAKTGRCLYERVPGEYKRFRIAAAQACQDTECRRHAIRHIRIERLTREIPDGGQRDLLESARSLARLFGQG